MNHSAARKQRCRGRQAAGKICLTVEVDEAALCVALVDSGFLRPEQQDDRAALAAALSCVIATLLVDLGTRSSAED